MARDKKTDHPHIVKTEGVLGGRARLKGHRISVEFIAGFFRAGYMPEDVVTWYPQLTLPAVYDAIGYYLDHQDEINEELAVVDEFDRDPDAFFTRRGYEKLPHGGYRFPKASG